MTRPKSKNLQPVIALLLAAAFAAVPMASPTPAMRSMHAVAHAQPPMCNTLPGAIYITGSSASRPLIREAQRALTLSSEAVTIVYISTASCDGVSAVVNDTLVTATANYFTFTDPTMASTVMTNTCTLPLTGVHPDISVADVSAGACGRNLTGTFDLQSDQMELSGPVQSMTFVVPMASTESSISGEAARMVFGFGGMSNVIAPWSVHAEIFNRPSSSGTQIMIGENIQLHSTLWTGNMVASSTNVRDGLLAASAAGIGILASDVADANRDHLRILAYQHIGQSCGYLPDSSATAVDKVNVREGRYAIWGALRFIVNVDGTGHPMPQASSNMAAMQRAVDFVTLNNLADADARLMITAAATASTVPLCAMHVTRTSESAAPTLMEPAAPCHGFFESLRGVPPGETAHATCSASTDCTAGTAHTCRYGFCEEH